MINQSFISKSHSSVIPNSEISKGHHSDLKMKEEDLKEILQYFEKHSSVAGNKETMLMAVKEFNSLTSSLHKIISPQVEFTYSYWLKKMNVESHLQENLIKQWRQGGGTQPIASSSTVVDEEYEKEEMVLDRNLYQTICTPNAHGIYGFRRLELHQESGLPARHYKPILKHGTMSWGENFNLKLQPPPIPELSSSSSSEPQPQLHPQQSFMEPLRAVPSPLRALLYERAHLLNVSQGLYDLSSGKPLYPAELSQGERVLRLAASHFFVRDVSPDSLFSLKRKRSHVVELSSDEHLILQPEESLHHLSSLDQDPEPLPPAAEFQPQNEDPFESTEVLLEIEKEREDEIEVKRRKVNQEENQVEEFHEELPPSSTPPAVMEMNVMGSEEDGHRTPTEKELQDLLGCAQFQALENSIGRHLEGVTDAVTEMVFQFLLPYANILWGESQNAHQNQDEGQEPSEDPSTPNEPPSRLQRKPRKKNPPATKNKKVKKSTMEVVLEDEEDRDEGDEEDRDDLTGRDMSDDFLNKIFKNIDYEIASMESCPTPVPPKSTKKGGNIHRSNPEFQLPLETNERLRKRTQQMNEIGEFFNWEHVFCAVQQSAESLAEETSFSNLPDGIEDGEIDEERLEELFFQAMNAESNEENRGQKSIEISPVLPPLHLNSKVVQRIQSRLIALFGMSRDVTPLHRSDSSKCWNFDSCSPGYPQSS